ncbi:hypothetical protein Tco_1273868 [Tanacetum coccineum]
MQIARDRQKSYADLKRKPMEFQVGDKVMLKVSPWKGVVRFGKRGKLNPRYVGSFKVLEKVGFVAYKLELPKELSRVYNMFHVSNLKKCYADEPLAVPLDGLHFDDKLQFIENQRGLEFTWEREDQFRKKYPHLFTKIAPSSNTVMSDSDDSTITYTEVSSPFEGLSDIGSLGVVGPEYDGLPWMLDDPYVQVILQPPPSPDYVPVPEEPQQAPPLPYFVPEPVYPEFMPSEDDVLLAEEQPLPAAVSPIANSPGYVPESDLEEDPEEDDDEDPKEDLADYPADGGDEGDDEDEDESFDDDEDDDVNIKGEEEEEEHPALADSTAVALPAVDHAPSAEETEPFEIDESGRRPYIHHQHLEVERLLALPSPSPSPLSPWSSPLPQIPSPPLLVSLPLPVSPLPLPASPTYPLGYRDAMIRLRAEAPSTSYSLPLPSPIILPQRIPRGLLTWPQEEAMLCLSLRYEVGKSSSAPTARPDGHFRRDYGFITTLDDEIMRDLERDVGYGIIDTWDEMLVDTDEIYGRMDDAQTELHMVTSRVNMLFRDRRTHARTARLIEIEARMSREAWGRSMDASNLACTEVMELRTQVVAQQSEITKVRATDRRRQTQLTEALKLMKTLQTQLTAL